MSESKDLSKYRSADTFDAVVVGGGLAGSSAAIHLARAGFSVVLFEKERSSSHKICGELVGGEAIELLKELGVDPRQLGAAPLEKFRIHGPRLALDREMPLEAYGFSRKRLDEKLLERAEAEGVDVRRGVSVEEWVDRLDSPSGFISVETSDGSVRSRRLIVAMGKSEFGPGDSREARDSGYSAFKMHLRLKPSTMKRLKKHCEFFVFERGYGALIPIEGDLANFCFLVEKKALADVGSDWDSLASHVAKTCWNASHFLDGAEPQYKNLLSLPSVPVGFVRRAPTPAGVFFVGDRMAQVPSITGDGMTIALLTGKSAAEAMIEKVAGENRLRFAAHASTSYQREMRMNLRPQVEAATYLQRLFKKPLFVDVAIRAAKRIPGLLDAVILATRCHANVARTARLSFRKYAVLGTRTSP